MDEAGERTSLAQLGSVLGTLPEAARSVDGEGALARSLDVSRSELRRLFHLGGRRSPASELAAVRLELAADSLERTDCDLTVLAASLGYGDEPDGAQRLNDQFERWFRLSAATYRSLAAGSQWEFSLPRGYPREALLDYFARHAVAPHLAVSGGRLSVGCWLGATPARLDMDFESTQATCRVATPRSTDDERSSQVARRAHRVVLRMLGLSAGSAGLRTASQRFQTLEGLPAPLRMLRVRQWLTPSPWEALLWAVTGQQISLIVTGLILTATAESYGVDVGEGVWALPRSRDLEGVSAEELGRLKFSRQKSKTLIELVRAGDSWAEMRWLPMQRARERLLAFHGIGPWTAGYVLMRGFGFDDAWPSGDAPLARAWGQLRGLPGKASAEQVEAEMSELSPHRGLATFRLWQEL